MNMMNNLVGRRVFNNSSYAPNRGQVPPAGYIQRGLAQRATQMNPNLNPMRRLNPQKQGPFGGVSQWGQDGQSDTRSGLAAQALQNNLGGGNDQVQAAGYKPITDTPEIGTQGNNGEVTKYTPESVSKRVFTPKPFTPRTVNIDAAGTLDIPAQYKFSAAAVAEQSKANADILNRQKEDQSADLAYQQGLFDVNNEYDTLSQDSLNKAAGSGAAFSSAMGKAIGSNSALRNFKTTGLDTLNTRTQNESTTEQAKIATALNEFLKGNALDAANSLDDQAGTLKLGSTSLGSKGSSKSSQLSYIKKKAALANQEAQIIHDKTGGYLSKLHELDSGTFSQSQEQMALAAQALQDAIQGGTNRNITEADAEQRRLGVEGAGLTSLRNSGITAEQLAGLGTGQDSDLLRTLMEQSQAQNSRYDNLNQVGLTEAERTIRQKQEADTESTNDYFNNLAKSSYSPFTPYKSSYTPYRSSYTPYRAPAPKPKATTFKPIKVSGNNFAAKWLNNAMAPKKVTTKQKSLAQILYPWKN